MKKHAILLLIILLSVFLMFACNRKEDKPHESGSQVTESGSVYDDDWYKDSQDEADGSYKSDDSQSSDDTQGSQSEHGGDSSSGSSPVSYQEDDDADWTPFL